MQLFSFKVYKICFCLLIGLVFFGPLAISSFAAERHIGFVNIQKALISTKEFKKKNEIFKKEFAKEKNKIKARENRMNKMVQDLNKQSFVLDPELKKEKEDRVRKEKIALDRYVQDQNADFSRKQNEIGQKILIKIVEVIKKIGKEKKYTMILPIKDVLYYGRGNDLTALVIRTYDRSNK